MSRTRNKMTRSTASTALLLLRIAAIAVLAVLLVSLFVTPNNGSGLSAFAFYSPNQSPPGPSNSPPGPSNSPPGPSNSPPGPFKSPPGPFHSPPGPFHSPLPPGQQGNGNGPGNGPSRRVELSYMPNSYENSPDAKGTVWVNGAFRDNHPQWPGFPPSIDYQIDHLHCRDFGFDMFGGYGLGGRWFYSLYMTVGNGDKVRLQSFNPGCQWFTYKSTVYLPDIPEDVLFNDDILFEVYLEYDDGVDTPWIDPPVDALIMSGEDIIN